MNKCLYCYQELEAGQKDFHPTCAKRFFGKTEAPTLPYSRSNINDLAKVSVLNRIAVTGVQSKLSMDVNKGGKDEPDRLTIVGLWGRFILKPKSDEFPWLPEVEDLTMHFASIAKIDVVPHTLIRFSDGELAYLTRRIDRDNHGSKYLMEDFCQISERVTADKYKSSYENIAKLIKKHSSAPLLDLVNFWEVVVFSWLTGNSDMHLKNFSLISKAHGNGVRAQGPVHPDAPVCLLAVHEHRRGEKVVVFKGCAPFLRQLRGFREPGRVRDQVQLRHLQHLV